MSLIFTLFVEFALVFGVSGLQYTQVTPGWFSSTPGWFSSTPNTDSSTKSTPVTYTSHHIPTTTPRTEPVYFVNDTEVCIILKTDIKIVVRKENSPNDTVEAIAVVDQPATGKCGKNNESITLTFFKDWKLTLAFSKYGEDEYFISQVDMHYNTMNLPHARIPLNEGNASLYNKTDYRNKDGLQYVCNDGFDVKGNFTHKKGNYSVIAELRNFKVEAFRHNATSIDFTENGVINCASNGNNLIPIIVGSVLIALILIVLIAYLISRRKRRTGYESV